MELYGNLVCFSSHKLKICLTVPLMMSMRVRGLDLVTFLTRLIHAPNQATGTSAHMQVVSHSLHRFFTHVFSFTYVACQCSDVWFCTNHNIRGWTKRFSLHQVKEESCQETCDKTEVEFFERHQDQDIWLHSMEGNSSFCPLSQSTLRVH